MFTEYGFGVGVSIDGPHHLNDTRLDRAGRSSFERTVAGIDRVNPSQAEQFWGRLWQLRGQYPQLRIRDLDRLGHWLQQWRSGAPRVTVAYDPIPTVSATGQVVVLSPEPLGVAAPDYNDFVVGNVLTDSLATIKGRLPRVGYVGEFERGLRRCAKACEFWDFCRGARTECGRIYFSVTAYI